jgi:DNA repair protein RadC
MNLLILDAAWRPRDRVPLVDDWRAVIGRLLALEGQWLAIHQQRPADAPALPSPVDIALTRTLTRRLRPLDMRLADHMIEAGESRFSFRAAGLL